MIRKFKWKIILYLLPEKLEIDDYEKFKVVEEVVNHLSFYKHSLENEYSWGECMRKMNDREIEIDCVGDALVFKQKCSFERK